MTYSGTMTLLNESETPAEDITIEIQEEDDEHQFFSLQMMQPLPTPIKMAMEIRLD